LTNENLYAQRFQHLENSFQEYSIATIKYKAGTYDMLEVLQLQTAQLSVESEVIKVRNARMATASTCTLLWAAALTRRRQSYRSNDRCHRRCPNTTAASQKHSLRFTLPWAGERG
jgi:hypothetical protein